MPNPIYHKDFRQGSLEWVRIRAGKATASDFNRIFDTRFKLRASEGLKTYIYEKCVEKFKGEPLPDFNNFETEQGAILESEARDIYRFDTDQEVETCGFIESADGRCGCSPDGLIGEDGGLEIKCPQIVQHTRYLIEGRLPVDYVQQVHGSLWVSGRQWWDFQSHKRSMPIFRIRIERDEKIMKKIETAMNAFYEKFDQAYEKLTALK